jgi:hypothetical protein
MVASSAYGGPRPLYGGIYTVLNQNEGIYYSTWVAAYFEASSTSKGFDAVF